MTTRPHGYARYKLDRCRCYVCCFAMSEYNRNRDKAIAAGVWRVDADLVRVHLRSLMVAGMGYKRIAAIAGLNVSTVRRILYGYPSRGTVPPTTTRYDIAHRLLAVQPDLAPTTPIEASGTVRRAGALVAIGYTLTEVAEAVGWTLSNFSYLMRRGSVPYAGRVEVRTARAVADLYDRWSMTPSSGPSADRARALARRHGWLPPLAWDDDQLDDPTATAAALLIDESECEAAA